jgi:tRNA 2-selenouridine synthase
MIYLDLLAADVPNFLKAGGRVLDVRASVEFQKGHFPGAVNLPILETDERAQVGTVFKAQGPQAAVVLGHQLVSGDIRSERVEGWKQFVREKKRVALTCFRGGQRSSLAQQWLKEEGLAVPRIRGGTKAVRSLYLAHLEGAGQWPLLVIGGPTGSGKTDLLRALAHKSIDLESFAEHRGSAFGRSDEAQPAQVTFENRIAQRAFELAEMPRWLVEDESAKIGRLFLPLPLWRAMQRAPVWEIVDPWADRVARIKKEYVDDPVRIKGVDAVQTAITQAVARLKQRLGNKRVSELNQLMQDGFRGLSGHEVWIEALLRDYYDPLYLAAQKGRKGEVSFRGSWREALEGLQAD